MSARSNFHSVVHTFIVLLALAWCGEAFSQSDADLEAAYKAANKVYVSGPTRVNLKDQASLQLPEGFLFVPAPEAGKILTAMGNHAGKGLLGLVYPNGGGQNWFAVARYEESGYIKDDDARDWDADELLDNLKAGTEQTNVERRQRGIPEMEVIGWVEPPNYNEAAHQLVWSVSTKDKGVADTGDRGINYNTYALGREGYISINLVTDLKEIGHQKKYAHALLAGLSFNEGKRYADFNSSTDHVAEYGVAALVGGFAAKKLGLLAAAGVFFAKFWKLLALGGVAVGSVFSKIFRRKSD